MLKGAKMKFTIYGNQENVKGNPIPYHRTTQGSKWSEAHRRYESWKGYVVNSFLLSNGAIYCWAACENLASCRKPLTSKKGEKWRIDIVIYFANERRGDCVNIMKGIEDALFHDDKYVTGSYDFFYDKENPRVEVEIKRRV